MLLLERARNIEHLTDFLNADKESWDYPHRGSAAVEMKRKSPVLQRDYPLNEQTWGMWTDERANPYVENKRFDWFRGYHVGGRSLLWGRQTYRWSDTDFKSNAKDGVVIDWPIRYADIAPWYDHVERFAGISGARDGLDFLPNGDFLPPSR
ncbi:hypothetical protein [Puniceibacterium antarcticum]|uniref:hypothetical protein n=1 Tax=Puniceibacterium antarcticum TaxID=1206336 RepID=UPI001FE83DE6|nr:hypothetical protein [Puniceibacterium antarcticum]